jgi:hypothetical protein
LHCGKDFCFCVLLALFVNGALEPAIGIYGMALMVLRGSLATPVACHDEWKRCAFPNPVLHKSAIPYTPITGRE